MYFNGWVWGERQGNITQGREPPGLPLTQGKRETEQLEEKLLSGAKSCRNVEPRNSPSASPC